MLAEGDAVWYRHRAGGWRRARVLKVYRDDPPPYYAIAVEGEDGERQTVREKLRERGGRHGEAPPDEPAPVAMPPDSPLLPEMAPLPAADAAAAAFDGGDDGFGEFGAAPALPMATPPVAAASPSIAPSVAPTFAAPLAFAAPPAAMPSVAPAAMASAAAQPFGAFAAAPPAAVGSAATASAGVSPIAPAAVAVVDDDDGFGDFDAAPAGPVAAVDDGVGEPGVARVNGGSADVPRGVIPAAPLDPDLFSAREVSDAPAGVGLQPPKVATIHAPEVLPAEAGDAPAAAPAPALVPAPSAAASAAVARSEPPVLAAVGPQVQSEVPAMVPGAQLSSSAYGAFEQAHGAAVQGAPLVGAEAIAAAGGVGPGDFGAFGAASTVAPASGARLSEGIDDDDFGDFGEACAIAPAAGGPVVSSASPAPLSKDAPLDLSLFGDDEEVGPLQNAPVSIAPPADAPEPEPAAVEMPEAASSSDAPALGLGGDDDDFGEFGGALAAGAAPEPAVDLSLFAGMEVSAGPKEAVHATPALPGPTNAAAADAVAGGAFENVGSVEANGADANGINSSEDDDFGDFEAGDGAAAPRVDAEAVRASDAEMHVKVATPSALTTGAPLDLGLFGDENNQLENAEVSIAPPPPEAIAKATPDAEASPHAAADVLRTEDARREEAASATAGEPLTRADSDDWVVDFASAQNGGSAQPAGLIQTPSTQSLDDAATTHDSSEDWALDFPSAHGNGSTQQATELAQAASTQSLEDIFGDLSFGAPSAPAGTGDQLAVGTDGISGAPGTPGDGRAKSPVAVGGALGALDAEFFFGGVPDSPRAEPASASPLSLFADMSLNEGVSSAASPGLAGPGTAGEAAGAPVLEVHARSARGGEAIGATDLFEGMSMSAGASESASPGTASPDSRRASLADAPSCWADILEVAAREAEASAAAWRAAGASDVRGELLASDRGRKWLHGLARVALAAHAIIAMCDGHLRSGLAGGDTLERCARARARWEAALAEGAAEGTPLGGTVSNDLQTAQWCGRGVSKALALAAAEAASGTGGGTCGLTGLPLEPLRGVVPPDALAGGRLVPAERLLARAR